MKDFIDSVIIKPEENVVVQTRRPKKQKEVKEDPKSKLTNRKVGYEDLYITWKIF